MEKKKCKYCEKPIPKARLEAIPETDMCVKCAETHGPKAKVGFMVYDGKTGSTLCTVDPDDEEALRRANRAHQREY
jgi:hypothetical protein